MSTSQPTPSLTWDWHFAAFGVRPRLTITWAFGCGLLAAGAARFNQGISPVVLIAGWLAADPLFGAISTHLLALRELRLQIRSLPQDYAADNGLDVPCLDGDSLHSGAPGFFRCFWNNLRAYPGLTGHSLSAVATAAACLVMAAFISPITSAVVACGLLLAAWVAILTGDDSLALAERSGGVQTAVAFMVAATIMGAFSWQLVLLAALFGFGGAVRPAWLRTGSRLLRLGMLAVWFGIVAYLLYTRQPVPAVLVGSAAISDQLCLKDNPEQAAGFIVTQIPWLVTLALVSLAASQWG